MVVRMIARVTMDTMASKVLYPPEEQSSERVALLAGIVQLITTALERAGDDAISEARAQYMKFDRGTIGYVNVKDKLYICEADNEKEAGNILEIIVDCIEETEDILVDKITKTLRKKGREISSLWG
ncbi:MAG: hypothetical protein P1Q69_16305 [Candidatus Thorarchaeota archaeon]|nr:hypothetical protein [Candidatus Thorarchaeota archaeon]